MPEVPQAISQYLIRRKIGEGGMGVVYEGWDERLQRTVAIKTIREASESEDSRRRLWREARPLARMSHPRVCQIFDVLEDRDTLFLVLEFLEGQSLADRIASGPMTAADAVGIELQLLEALEALHDLGIIHRDLKPSNAFLTPHGVKLLDFGLAYTTGSSTARDAEQIKTAIAITGPGLIVGTPQYMAPEQAMGGEAGPAADIFAAGCIFYEMLTGRCPFGGTSHVDILYAVLHHDPPSLSGSREIEALDQVIRRAIGKRLEDRYPSARSMIEALNAVPLSGNTAARTAARAVTRLIALPFRVLKKDEETDFLADSLPDAISSALSGIDHLIVRSSLLAPRIDSGVDPKRIAAELGVDAILTGSLMRAGNQIRLACQLIEAPSGTVKWSGTITSSLDDLFRIQDELSEQIVQSLMLPLSDRERHSVHRDVPANASAYEYYLRANQITGIRNPDNMRLARELYLQCLREDPNYAPAWARLGRVIRFIEKFGEGSDRELSAVDDAYRKAFAINPDLAIAHNLYTLVECDQGRADQAVLRLLQRARFLRNDPDLLAGLVQACRYCDNLDASVAAHLRAQRLDPYAATSAAHTYFLLGEYQKSLECYGKAGYYLDCAALAALGDRETALLRLRERERAQGPTGLVQPLMRSLRAYIEGNFDECLHTVNAAIPLTAKDPESLFYLGRHLALIGQPERALDVLSTVVEKGFLCGSALERDSCFAALRPSPRYSEILQLAVRRRGQAHAAFLEAGGNELLNLA
jgi:non-specific serine/threonine protein kinase